MRPLDTWQLVALVYMATFRWERGPALNLTAILVRAVFREHKAPRINEACMRERGPALNLTAIF